MRLLHTTDLRFQEFFDTDIAEYAILSHRWGPDEVSYQEFTAIRNSYLRLVWELPELYILGWFDVVQLLGCVVPRWAVAVVQSGELIARSSGWNNSLRLLMLSLLILLANSLPATFVRPKQYGSGYAKILACCDYAATDTITVWSWSASARRRWVWVDTCRIDKSSSTELTEAVNSMYRWYREARICYAYVSDVPGEEVLAKFAKSQWFRRGWTMQELLAPRSLMFLTADWRFLGCREALESEIAAITGIKRANDFSTVPKPQDHQPSIAIKLGWTARRETSRLEDSAYCLLGLFSISMPLLNGEGENAFRRRQIELLSSTDDESLFVWRDIGFRPRNAWPPRQRSGLLASGSNQFKQPYTIGSTEYRKFVWRSRPRYSITNQGSELIVPAELANCTSFLFPRNCCHYEESDLKGVFAIHLRKNGLTWARFLKNEANAELPALNETVYRWSVDGLFIVPAAWIWTRKDLANTDSEVIYAEI